MTTLANIIFNREDESIFSSIRQRTRMPTLAIFIQHSLGNLEHSNQKKNFLNPNWREQDGRGVGGCGVHLPPQIHQEYTFRHRSA